MSDIAALVADNLDIWTGAIERKSGAGRGGGKRISLYGIDRLRALILDLAVRGKLVPQDAGDEPASNLLARISLRKERLVAEGVIRKSKSLNRAVIDSEPFEAPHGWAFSSLGAVAEKLTDGSHNPPADAGHGYPMLSSQNVFDGQIAIDAPSRWVSKEGFEKENLRTNIQTNDVLLTIVASIGRSAVVTENLGPFVLQRSVAVISSQLYPKFLSLSFQAPFCANYMWQHAKGTAQKGIYLGKLAAMPLPIPPLAEQQRIVAKVDELMALCDALERESAAAMAAHQALVEILLETLVNSADAADLARDWARLERHFDTLFTTDASIDALKQTVLNLAVRGKLIEQNALDETAKLEKKVKEATESSVEVLISLGASLPRNWIAAPLEYLTGPMDSGWSPACHEYCSESDDAWGVLKTTAVQNMRFEAQQNKALPSKLQPRESAETHAGDVLITRAGPTNRVGICCFVKTTRPRLMISDKIIRFRPTSSVINGEFMALALSVGPATQQMERAKSGMAASQVNISQSKLKAIIIPVPPLAEQRRIVAKVDAVMALCDALKARLADAMQTQRHLADAITQRAAA